jgi:hypothetical protein
MIDEPTGQPPEAPRFEPEILPPERMESAFRSGQTFAGMRVISVGPVRLAFWVAGILLLLGLLLFAFAGALLVLAPFVAAVVVGSVAWAWLRRFFQSGR